MKKIELDKMTIEQYAPDILFITLKDGIIIEDYDVIEAKKHNLELTKGNQYAIIFDTGNFTTVSQEAREAMASSEIEANRKATAYVINSLAQRLVGNFYLRVNKPNVPSKIFTDKKKAMKWVKMILGNN